MYEREVLQISICTEFWHYDLKHYLSRGECLDNMNSKHSIELRLKYAQYHMINDILFRKNYDGILLICLEKDDAQKVLSDLHDGFASEHYGCVTIAHKII